MNENEWEDEREGEWEEEEWYWEDDMPTPVSKAWWVDLTA